MTDSTSSKDVAQLGRRLAARRREAGIDADLLSVRAGVARDAIESFERGEIPLGAGAVTRIATALGIAPAGLLSVSAPEVPAPTAPEAFLLGPSTAWLRLRDKERIARHIERARAFVSLGELLCIKRIDQAFGAAVAPLTDPHFDGYAAAREARAALDQRGSPIRELSRTIEDRFDILVARFRFESPGVRAAAARSGSARLIVLDARLERAGSVRRALAHELAHHLRDLGTDGAVVDTVREAEGYSHEKPAVEKRADAFALMFLAPEQGLTELLGPPRSVHDLAAARNLATRVRQSFGLGFEASVWHLLNLGYLADREVAETLIDEPTEGEVMGFDERALPYGLERRLRAAESLSLLSSGRRRELLGQSVFDEA